MTYRIHGATGEWEVVIGLEVHAQVTSNSKLFSGAATAFGAAERCGRVGRADRDGRAGGPGGLEGFLLGGWHGWMLGGCP